MNPLENPTHVFVFKLRISPFSGNLIIMNLIYTILKLFYFLIMWLGYYFNILNFNFSYHQIKFMKIHVLIK